ncbi:MAG: PepSY domain-containing protein [Acidobacteriota bacterium]|nr:PepSY domain-containing protein [Acidobacteriota bacterium]
MNIKRNILIALTAGSLATAGFAMVPTTTTTASAPRSDVPAALAKHATVTLDAARATALAQVPGATVKSEELEREHGKLIYSFDLQVPGKSGVEEVNVSATDGKVVARKHETAKAESREKRKDAHHATKPNTPKQ